MTGLNAYPVDLHLHSVASDGLKTPRELCAMADEQMMTHIALADHDTLDGWPALAEAAERVREARRARGDRRAFVAIPAVEMSSGQGGRVHLMGYAPNPADPALTRCLQDAAADRSRRAGEMLRRLDGLGLILPQDARAALTGPHAGRAHIARALVRAGLVASVSEAFDRYLAEGRDAYVPRRLLPPEQALAVLKGAGAVTALAHPTRLSQEEPLLSALLDALREGGLDGVEAYHPSASRKAARALERYARQRGLLVTGGSDYHGDADARARVGHMPSGWLAAAEDAQELLARLRPF